ncbi:MAG: Mpo1-like protein [Isosphaeraceae bacterium]
MNEFSHSNSANSPNSRAGSWHASLIARYHEDHRHPINHVLHIGVGWPMVALAVILVPFHPFWSLGLFVSAYAVMFSGHFLFERNIPTVLQHPTTPFVIAGSVIRVLWGGLARLAMPYRPR